MPAAKAQAASIEHDLAMEAERANRAIDPAIAERQRQEAALKAAAPLRKPVEQDGTMGSPLFDAVDQPGFRLSPEGDETGFAAALKPHDDDLAAVERARACMAPPKGSGV